MSADRSAQLESLLTQSENEIAFLESTLKKIKKEYDHNFTEVTKKLRDYESREKEVGELQKNFSQKDHEIELLKAKNQKLEEKIKDTITNEAQKIGQTLNRNQALEKENLDLYTAKVNLEERLREMSTQINHYKNLNEAHEKHQDLAKRNISRLEEQIEKHNNEINEIKRKNITDITAKNEEITMLKFRVEEFSTMAESLQRQLDHKEELIRELGSHNALEEAHHKIKDLNEKLYESQNNFAKTRNELDNLRSLHNSEANKYAQRIDEYEQIIAGLRKNIEDQNASLREAQLENKKIQFEMENERDIRGTIENFKVPMFHKERLEELNRKVIENEQKYYRAVEENKKLSAELIKVRSQTSQKIADLMKNQQNETKDNFALLISKLQLAIDKNKFINEENSRLKKEIETRDEEIKHLHGEVEGFISKIRTLTLEGNKLKTRLNQLDASLNLDLLSKEQVDQIKDQEINTLRENNRRITREFEEISKNSVNSQALKQLKSDYELQAKELETKSEIIEGLMKQLNVLRQASAVNLMVSSSESTERQSLERKQSIPMVYEQGEDLQKQMNELLQKRFEFENIKQRLTQENSVLTRENRDLSRKVSELQLKLNELESHKAENKNKISILEKERDLKAQTIKNREQHLADLTLEHNKLLDERNELLNKVNDLEETRERFAEKVRFYEEYTNRLNQINVDIIRDKEIYLKTILNQKNEIALIERRHQGDLEKISKEREELREQFVNSNNERVIAMKKYYDATFANRIRLENQSIIITNFLKKIQYLESVTAELDGKVNEYLQASQKDYEKNLPKLSEISNILNKSRLTAEDYKTFDAIKELLSQQRAQYEESVKFLENTIETLGQRYLALEETYLNDKKSYMEQIEKLRKDNFDTINRYENKLRENEENIKALEEAKAKVKPKAAATTTTEEGEVGEMEVEDEGEERALDETESGDVIALRIELNTERELKLKLENDLETERERAHRSEDEKQGYLRRLNDLENEKAKLSKMFTLRESSWVEQKKQYNQQIEEFREDDRKRAQQVEDLADKLEIAQSQQVGEKDTELQSETRHQDLLVQIENLRSDNLSLKRTLEEKNKEVEVKGDAGESMVPEIEERNAQLEAEKNRLQEELEDLKVKVKVLEGPIVAGGEMTEEDLITTGSEQELQELRKALDSGSLLNVLERAQSLLLAISHKPTI